MYKETLRGIAGIGLFPVVSLLMFVCVFLLVLLRVVRMDRGEAQQLAGMPLDDPHGAARRQEATR